MEASIGHFQSLESAGPEKHHGVIEQCYGSENTFTYPHLSDEEHMSTEETGYKANATASASERLERGYMQYGYASLNFLRNYMIFHLSIIIVFSSVACLSGGAGGEIQSVDRWASIWKDNVLTISYSVCIHSFGLKMWCYPNHSFSDRYMDG